MNNDNLVNFLLTRNKEQSEYFCRHALARQQYRAKHSTKIITSKCMDGRLNLSVMTKIPVGIIQPYRNIGGKFDFGWPYFGTLLRKQVEYAINQGNDCLFLATYHFSKSDKHRGCAGCNYEIEEGKKVTQNLIEDLAEAFGNEVFYPIQVGIETDDEALIVHGKNGEVLDIGQSENMTEQELRSKLIEIFPNMKLHVIDDFMPLLLGNQQHVKEIRASNRPIADAEHREQILAIGRGFDWLHLPNKALIIGPYSFELGGPIELAAKLLLSNIQSGRVSDKEGIVLMTSAVYGNKAEIEYRQALFKSRAFANFAMDVITKRVPELVPYMHDEPLVGVVDYNTLEFSKLDFDGKFIK